MLHQFMNLKKRIESAMEEERKKIAPRIESQKEN